MNKKAEEVAFLTGVDGKHSNKCSLLFCNPLMMYLLVARILIIVLEHSQGLEELWLELDDAEGFAGAIIVIAVHPLAPELCTSAWLEYVNCYSFSFFLTFVTLTTLTFPSTVQLVHLFLLSLV